MENTPFPFEVYLSADHAQYLQRSVHGSGTTPLEALEDALESLSTGDDAEAKAAQSVPFPLPRELAAQALGCDDANLDCDIYDEMDVPEPDREASEVYWYVVLELAE